MRGIRWLVVLGASLLLAPAEAPAVVDFAPAAPAGCIIVGIIDDPEPFPSGIVAFGNGAIHFARGAEGEIVLSAPPSRLCSRARIVPVVAWESTSPQGPRGMMLRYALDGAWSEPAYLGDSADEPWEPAATALGTLRLVTGTTAPDEEASRIPSSRLRRPLAKAAPAPSRAADRRDGPPSLAVSPLTGATVVAWARRSAGGFDVLVSELVGGSWTGPRTVAGSGEDERDPSLVIGDDGTVHLFYWVDGPDPRVLHRQASADLTTWSPALRVSAQDEIASRPAGAFHDGILRVAYERHDLGLDRSPRSIVLSHREGDGWTGEVLAVSPSATPLWPRPHSEDGVLWVDWDDGAGASGWVRKDPLGAWERPRYEPLVAGEAREEVRVRALTAP
jgi:hypothetical protein